MATSRTGARSVDPTTFDWDAQAKLLVDDEAQTGNRTRFIIHRLCEFKDLSALAPNQNCSDSPVLNSGDSRGGASYPGILPGATSKPFFRITTRVDGPRNTTSFTQVLVQ